jgi:5'-3' exonuclease
MGERIVCSPDKDLRQIPGKLYDYHKGIMEEISEQEAVHNLRMQMLCGDVTDNVKGIPGMGDVKATKYLKENPEADAVYKAYIRHFGDYYGTIIHEETLATLEVVRPNHIYASYFENDLNRIQAVPFEDTETNVFLRELD